MGNIGCSDIHNALDISLYLAQRPFMKKRIALEPASTIIAACGGTSVVSEATGVDRTQVWRWTQSRARGGTDGRIPSEHQVQLLTWARANGKPVTPEMFFLGSDDQSTACVTRTQLRASA